MSESARKAQEKAARLAAALRENLKRRKAQARGAQDTETRKEDDR